MAGMRRQSREITDQVLPSEKELDEDVILKLRLSDMYFFLNVPDVKVSSASGEAAELADRNEAYAEVRPSETSHPQGWGGRVGQARLNVLNIYTRYINRNTTFL